MYLDLFSEESRQSLHFGRFDCISIDAFLAMSGPLNVNFFLGEHTPGSQIRAPLSTLLRGLSLSTLASSISNAVPHPWKHLQYGYPVLYRQFQNHDLAWRTGAICSQKASARQARGKRKASEGPSPVVLVSSPSLSSSFCSPEKHERTIIMPVLQANNDCTRQQKLLEVLWGRILSTDGEVGTSITNSASQCKGWEDNSIFKRNQLLRLSINRQNLPIKNQWCDGWTSHKNVILECFILMKNSLWCIEVVYIWYSRHSIKTTTTESTFKWLVYFNILLVSCGMASSRSYLITF